LPAPTLFPYTTLFRSKGRALLLGMLLLSLSLAAFAVNRSFPAALALLFCTGAASLLFSTMMTTMLQLDVAPAMRGRIMALVSVSDRKSTRLNSSHLVI